MRNVDIMKNVVISNNLLRRMRTAVVLILFSYPMRTGPQPNELINFEDRPGHLCPPSIGLAGKLVIIGLMHGTVCVPFALCEEPLGPHPCCHPPPPLQLVHLLLKLIKSFKFSKMSRNGYINGFL